MTDVAVEDKSAIAIGRYSGLVTHPDQILVRAWGPRERFSTQIRPVIILGSRRARAHLLEHRDGDVEAGLFADKAAGLGRFARAANPVKPDLYRLVL